MNYAVKNGIRLHAIPISQRASQIHSTAVLEKGRRTHWEARWSNYNKRFRRVEAKRTMLRNVNAYAEYLFQSWKKDDDPQDNSSFRTSSSWYKTAFAGNSRRSKKGSKTEESPWESYRMNRKGGFQFSFDGDEEVETIFRYAFNRKPNFYWSFTDNESFHWGSSSNHYQSTWSWRHDTHDSSSETKFSTTESVSDRLALGLKTSGPLKLEEVKNAYRACALKWHPDRHQGSSKVTAEEKFKHCTAAYQSLCEKLALS